MLMISQLLRHDRNYQRWKFVQDDDCHWYLIQAELEDEFNDWVYGEEVSDSAPSFDAFRCDSPEFYTFESPVRED